MNTKSADDNIEDGDDKDNCNGDIVENGGRLVVFCVVYIQTSQHQKEYASQNLRGNNDMILVKKLGIFFEDLEDDTCDNENEKNSVELVLLSYLTH